MSRATMIVTIAGITKPDTSTLAPVKVRKEGDSYRIAAMWPFTVIRYRPCGYCGAARKESCKTSSGAKAKKIHQQRYLVPENEVIR